MEDVRSRSIDHLDLGGHARNALVAANIVLVGDLVRRRSLDLLKLRRLGRGCLRDINRALGKAGLSLGMSDADIDSASETSPLVSQPLEVTGAETLKDELVQVIRELLRHHSSNLACFMGYYGLEDGRGKTMEEVARQGIGFGRPVSTERVRQVINGARRILKVESARVRLHCWGAAVEDVHEALPMSVHSFLSRLGFESVMTPTGLFESLGFCASILDVDFPFAIQRQSHQRSQHSDLVVTQRDGRSSACFDSPRPWKGRSGVRPVAAVAHDHRAVHQQ